MKKYDSHQVEKNIAKITDSEDLVDILIDIENYLDNNYLYTYKNWIDGEIVDGPRVKKYWVTVILKFPWEKMPDPVGGTRLIPHGTKVNFRQAHEQVPVEIKSPSDYKAGTRKPKMKRVKIWLVELQIPRKFVSNISQDIADMYDEDVDTDIVDDAAAQGISDSSEDMGGW